MIGLPWFCGAVYAEEMVQTTVFDLGLTALADPITMEKSHRARAQVDSHFSEERANEHIEYENL